MKKREIILVATLYIILAIWLIVCVVHTGLEKPTTDNLTVEEKIRCEFRIFPY